MKKEMVDNLLSNIFYEKTETSVCSFQITGLNTGIKKCIHTRYVCYFSGRYTLSSNGDATLTNKKRQGKQDTHIIGWW
jgi:hypothetical protein